MAFVDNASKIAKRVMKDIEPDLSAKFGKIVTFLATHPDKDWSLGIEVGTDNFIQKQAEAFAKGRIPICPTRPATTPDEMVSIILVSFFDVAEEDTDRIKEEHLLSMRAENLVGDLLERYLASVLEPAGWIWCSGAVVGAVDFIKPPSRKNSEWKLLQIKNRDNSENSSSSKVRVGKDIDIWFRTFSKPPKRKSKKKGGWDKFPDEAQRKNLSEDGFRSFVKDYLSKNKLDENKTIKVGK